MRRPRPCPIRCRRGTIHARLAGLRSRRSAIATFDNDGTLWCEQPIYFQVAFAFDEVKRLAEWKKQQPFKDLLEGKMQRVADAGEKSLLEIIMATHSGMSVEDFSKIVLDWVTTAQHPRLKRPYIDIVYQPMQELMRYLRANDFKTFIVSGGGIEFMRPWTEKVYGIPPQQVVGSSGVTKWQMQPDGKPVLMKLPEVEFVDDVPASRSASTGSSAAVRYLPSVIPTAINRCWNGPRRVPARASWGLCIIPTPSANMPMTASRKWAGSIKRSTRPMPKAGPRHETGLEQGLRLPTMIRAGGTADEEERMRAIVKRLLTAGLFLVLFLASPYAASAQTQSQPGSDQQLPTPQASAPTAAPAQQLLSAGQLDALVAPIALYPDALLSEILMASSYPLEVIEADRWAQANKNLKGDALKAAVGQQSWDDSVKSLVATPSVLDMMSDKLSWTQQLGDAVLAQQPDVMDAIQRLRAKAQANNKLVSNQQQTVSTQSQDGRQVIVIAPTQPDTLYVPYYDPSVVYGQWPYPSYPPYYWPAPGYIAAGVIATGLVFGAGYALGRWASGGNYWGGGFNWGGNNINANRNININNINRGNGNNWVHNPAHRQGVRYSNANVAAKFGGNRNVGGGAQNRIDFRGRAGNQVLNPGAGGGIGNRPNIGGNAPNIGGGNRPNVGGGGNRPNVGGGNRP
ncbi:MAG: DUF3300 domain-containing protein, partial [Xanthobacteraceae bacterium]